MKLKHLLLSAALFAAFGASAQQANVYASDLKANVTGNQAEITFTLNTHAAAVDLLIGEKTFSLGTNLDKGVHSVTVTLDGVTGENLPWSVKASAEAVTEPVKLDDKTTCDNMDFYNARGIKLDNNLESPFFGRIYVAESGHADESRTSNGLYVFNSAFEDVTGQGNTPYAGGIEFTATSASPQRVFVAKDALYMCDWSDSNTSGVFKADPANLNAPFKPVFEGTHNADGLITNDEGVAIAGSIVSIWVDGEGENTVLYTYDEDLQGGKQIFRYDIGALENPWTSAPTAVEYNNPAGLSVNMSAAIYPDANGWWLSQYRWLENADQPALIHYNSTTGAIDFNSATADEAGVLVGNSQQGGMTINEEGNLLAIANSDAVKVFEIGETADGAPLLTLKYTIPHGLNTRVWDLAFDVAGNLYQANDQQAGLALFALPKAENTFTTPAIADQYITIGGGGPGVPGDVDGNGIVDTADMSIVIDAILGLVDCPAADIDGNGIIDTTDMSLVIDIILGL